MENTQTVKHTPGPWFVSKRDSRVDGEIVALNIMGNSGTEYIGTAGCTIGNSQSIDQMEMNANLIAAAPELLECLVEGFNRLHKSDTNLAEARAIGPILQKWRQVLEKAGVEFEPDFGKAIAKAEGRA